MTYHVMQDWTAQMSHRQQGVLILALRGPDGSVKESSTKPIVRALRACSMNNGETGIPMERDEFLPHDSFMSMRFICNESWWDDVINGFLKEIDNLNLHYWQHLIHAAAVLGFNHPWDDIRERWLGLYHRACKKVHLNPETREQFTHRLRDGRRTYEEETA